MAKVATRFGYRSLVWHDIVELVKVSYIVGVVGPFLREIIEPRVADCTPVSVELPVIDAVSDCVLGLE